MITYDEIKPAGPPTKPLEKVTGATAVAVRREPDVAVPVEITPVRLEPVRRPLTLNTARVLDHVRRILAYWARWDSDAWLDVATLWTASTWFTDSEGNLLFAAHPRFFLIAPPGSGKTRIMKVMRSMVRDPTGIVKGVVTAPGVRDALLAHRTVFLDEFDRKVGRGHANQDLQALVSAYEADTGSLNGKGGLNEESVFGAMVLAAKPRILTGTNGYLEDLMERSFVITPAKSADEIPDLDGDFEQATELMPRILQAWGEAARPPSGKLWPVHDMPAALSARDREISQALIAVADRAVDPAVLAAEGADVRWALKARAAVQEILLGHGSNGPEILADVTARLDELGV